MSSHAKIAEQLQYQPDILSPNKMHVSLGWGFPYEAYAPSATVKPWHILSMVEGVKNQCFHHVPPFLDARVLNSQGLFGFLHCIKLLISKDMYDVSVPKSPLDVEGELVHVGKTSMTFQIKICLPSRSLTLAVCEDLIVLVDIATRRPAPHPQWWMDKFGQFTDPKRQLRVTVEKEPLNRNAVNMDSLQGHGGGVNSTKEQSCDFQQNDLPIAMGVSSRDLIVCDSETDPNGHVNWSLFLKYCLDAMVMGSSPERARELKRHALKSAEIAYISEATMGEKIRVNFWKDDNLPRAVHFHIKGCETNKLMTYALLQFYSLQDVELTISKLQHIFDI